MVIIGYTAYLVALPTYHNLKSFVQADTIPIKMLT